MYLSWSAVVGRPKVVPGMMVALACNLFPSTSFVKVTVFVVCVLTLLLDGVKYPSEAKFFSIATKFMGRYLGIASRIHEVPITVPKCVSKGLKVKGESKDQGIKRQLWQFQRYPFWYPFLSLLGDLG